MSWRDKDVILEGTHHKLIYNENFIAMPFMVVEKNSGLRLASYSSERAGRAAVRHYDKKLENQTVG
jgi:hypothetical protein